MKEEGLWRRGVKVSHSFLRATHFLPSMVVAGTVMLLSVVVGLDSWRVAVLGVVAILDQFSVGLSNDWIDATRDRDAHRSDKPIAQGDIGVVFVRNGAFVALALSVALSVILGWPAAVAHVIALGSAWSYNLGVKSTILSPMPYLISFGLLPVIVTLSNSEPFWPSPWIFAGAAFLGISAHFANVIPDMDEDIASGVIGLPHKIGVRSSMLAMAVTLAVASACIAISEGPEIGWVGILGLSLSLAISALLVVSAARGRRLQFVWTLAIVGGIVNSLALAFSAAGATP